MNRERMFLNEEQCQNCKYDMSHACAIHGKCEDCYMSITTDGVDGCLCTQRATDEEEQKSKCKYFIRRSTKNGSSRFYK